MEADGQETENITVFNIKIKANHKAQRGAVVFSGHGVREAMPERSHTELHGAL